MEEEKKTILPPRPSRHSFTCCMHVLFKALRVQKLHGKFLHACVPFPNLQFSRLYYQSPYHYYLFYSNGIV